MACVACYAEKYKWLVWDNDDWSAIYEIFLRRNVCFPEKTYVTRQKAAGWASNGALFSAADQILHNPWRIQVYLSVGDRNFVCFRQWPGFSGDGGGMRLPMLDVRCHRHAAWHHIWQLTLSRDIHFNLCCLQRGQFRKQKITGGNLKTDVYYFMVSHLVPSSSSEPDCST